MSRRAWSNRSSIWRGAEGQVAVGRGEAEHGAAGLGAAGHFWKLKCLLSNLRL